MNIRLPNYRLFAVAAAAAAAMGLAGRASAVPLVVRPSAAASQDTFVYQSMPAFNFDAAFASVIVVGKSTVPHDLNGLIRFDVAGATLADGERATLNLYVLDTSASGIPSVSPTPAGPATVNVATAAGPWAASSVTWNSGIAGGATLDSAEVDGIHRWVSLDVTDAVRGWIDEPSSNHGLILTQAAAVNSGGWVGLVFQSAANDAENRPFLEIAAVPEPASLGLAGVALLGLARRHRR